MTHISSSGAGEATPPSSDPEGGARGERDGGNDVRWAVNYLLEQIAAKFEAWDTMDLWRSDAASLVRSFKHDLTRTPSADHDDGNLRGLSEQTDSHGDGYFGLARERGYIMPSAPNHQPHAVSQGWRDIETAPRDGSWILATDHRYPTSTVTMVRWETNENARKPKPYWAFVDERIHGVGMSRAYQPTHWMPLPAPPSPAKTGGAE